MEQEILGKDLLKLSKECRTLANKLENINDLIDNKAMNIELERSIKRLRLLSNSLQTGTTTNRKIEL